MDFTYNIRALISPSGHELDYGKEELEIHAQDDLDERYLIRTKESDGMWLNFLKSPLWVQKLSSPEKGVIEVTVRKDYPKYRDCEDIEKFLKDVESYFTDLFHGRSIFGTSFRMREERTIDQATTCEMIYTDEGDEIGLEERDVDVYIGSTFILDGPTHGDEEGYTAFSEDMKAFILSKLEAIFDKKGAYCWETSHENEAFGILFHYEFKIKIF